MNKNLKIDKKIISFFSKLGYKKLRFEYDKYSDRYRLLHNKDNNAFYYCDCRKHCVGCNGKPERDLSSFPFRPHCLSVEFISVRENEDCNKKIIKKLSGLTIIGVEGWKYKIFPKELE